MYTKYWWNYTKRSISTSHINKQADYKQCSNAMHQRITEWPLSKQCEIPWRFAALLGGTQHVKCYSYRAAMQSLENQIWRSRLAVSTKLKLYNTCTLPIFLYGSDSWAISKTDTRKINALDQWCIHMLPGQMVPICTEQWCMEVNEATQTHHYNPVAPAYPVWAYYAHERQCRCQEDPVSLPSGRLEKTTRSSPHHVAQNHPTGYETTPPYAPRSSRFGSELPSVEDDVDVWRYAILELHARNDDDDISCPY